MASAPQPLFTACSHSASLSLDPSLWVFASESPMREHQFGWTDTGLWAMLLIQAMTAAPGQGSKSASAAVVRAVAAQRCQPLSRAAPAQGESYVYIQGVGLYSQNPTHPEPLQRFQALLHSQECQRQAATETDPSEYCSRTALHQGLPEAQTATTKLSTSCEPCTPTEAREPGTMGSLAFTKLQDFGDKKKCVLFCPTKHLSPLILPLFFPGKFNFKTKKHVF